MWNIVLDIYFLIWPQWWKICILILFFFDFSAFKCDFVGDSLWIHSRNNQFSQRISIYPSRNCISLLNSIFSLDFIFNLTNELWRTNNGIVQTWSLKVVFTFQFIRVNICANCVQDYGDRIPRSCYESSTNQSKLFNIFFFSFFNDFNVRDIFSCFDLFFWLARNSSSSHDNLCDFSIMLGLFKGFLNILAISNISFNDALESYLSFSEELS